MTQNITIVGNVGTEPSVEKTAAGRTFTRMRVVCSPRVRDAESGQWRDGESSWYNLFAYGTLAENAIKSVRKGMRIVATGTLRVHRWERDERSGINVDLSADALGIDLKWGKVTGFDRTVGGRRRDQPAAEEEQSDWMPPADPDTGEVVDEAPEPGSDAAEDADRKEPVTTPF